MAPFLPVHTVNCVQTLKVSGSGEGSATGWGGVDDVGFVRKVVEGSISAADHTIDTSRIYFSGHSMGCMMTQRMMIEANDLITAAGCMAGYLSVPSQPVANNIPFIEVHGTADATVNFTHYSDEPAVADQTVGTVLSSP
jgi:poly(3-hydroxybutyrate) depolymerase